MIWSALVPLKPAAERKSRLAEVLSGDERAMLSQRLFDHVATVLAAVPDVAIVTLLADRRPSGWSGGWSGGWIADTGRGLNAELQAAAVARPLLVIHADLPLLSVADVEALLAAAEGSGCAIAPDRHGSGTNALALADARGFAFGFGAGSFARHRAQAADAAVVERLGLGLDLDTPDDLDAAAAAGWSAEN